MRKLRGWLQRRGFRLKLVRKAKNEVCCTDKVVTLQTTLTLKSQVATLLHECGHVLVHLARKRSRCTKVAGASWKDWESLRDSRSKRSELLALQEEMVAWDRGERLARRLRIKVCTKFQRLVRTRALMTYVRHLAAPSLVPRDVRSQRGR